MKIYQKAAMAAALGVSLLASAASAQEIKVWELSSTNEGVNNNWAQVIASFEEANPGVTIKFETFETEAFKQGLAVALTTDNGPDVFFNWGSEDSAALARNGLVADLTDMGEGRWLEVIDEGKLAPFAVNGRVYGVPTHLIAKYMYYDTAFYADNNLTFPETTDEVFEMCKMVPEMSDRTFSILGNKDQWKGIHYVSMLTAAYVGVDQMNNDIRLQADDADLFTHPGYAQALAFMRRMETEGCFQPGVNTTDASMSDTLFANRMSSSNYCGTWCTGSLDGQGMEGAYSLAPFPMVSDAPEENQGFILGLTEGFQISERSQHKEIAADFLNHLLSDDVQASRLTMAARIPLNGAGVPAVADQVHPAIQQVVADLPSYKGFAPILDVDLNGELVDIYKRGIQDVIDGRVSPEDLMAQVREAALNIKSEQ